MVHFECVYFGQPLSENSLFIIRTTYVRKCTNRRNMVVLFNAGFYCIYENKENQISKTKSNKFKGPKPQDNSPRPSTD